MADLEQTLRSRFGLSAFRPWQREAIDALLSDPGRVLVIAPTGGGKSLCYQLPATVLEGTTVVVSPLIALMEDQVRSLTERGIAATYIASNLAPDERYRRLDKLRAGEYQLAYVAPERLRNASTISLFKQLRPPLVAIDEAHCISQWGHDFRPDYLRLGEFLEEVAPKRVLACTATATPLVRDEIVERLGMPDDTSVILRGFARPNLRLEVEETDKVAQRRQIAIAKVHELLGPPQQAHEGAIIYAGTRKNTEKLAAEMSDRGWRCLPYHAGLDPAEREAASLRFADRSVNVVVATNAFGMGIDRPDIRAVVHLMAPGSIEQYYQEVGRAGRDGEPAHGLLLSGTSDYAFRRRLIAYAQEEREDTSRLEREWDLFLDLMRYVEAGTCRHDFILNYFGDESEALGGCGHCDVCEHLAASEQRTGTAMSTAEVVVVQKALAGVARLRRRAGLTALATSLHGTRTARIEQLGLHELSTHGILADYPQEWILSLLRRLLTAALVELTPSDFPVPYLTHAGIAAMKGEAPIRVMLPRQRPRATQSTKSAKRRKKGAEPVACDDPALFEKLREVRTALAKAHQVAPFMVCHDRTLAEMANSKPRTTDELLEVHGMGPTKVSSYGEPFVAAIVEHSSAN